MEPVTPQHSAFPATPFFAIRTAPLQQHCDDLRSALHRFFPDGIIGYSVKTNHLPWLIRFMSQQGFYIETVSSDEFNLARALHVPPAQIIFNGPVKERAEFFTALQNTGFVNLDAVRELRWLDEFVRNDRQKLQAKLGLRVNCDLTKTCPHDFSDAGSRFGFSVETGALQTAVDAFKSLDLPLHTLHFHFSSKTRAPQIYRAIAETAVALVEKYSLKPTFIDIGGGFFHDPPREPSFDAYFSAVHAVFQRNPLLKNAKLIVEPGMALVGATIDYYTRVVDVRDNVYGRFVTLDGSRIHIDPLMHKSSYAYTILPNATNDDATAQSNLGSSAAPNLGSSTAPTATPILPAQQLAGFTCMENDRFFTLKNAPALREGDLIRFKKTGAYTMGLASLFIRFYPAIYLEDASGTLTLLRDRLTADDFLNFVKTI